MINQNKEINSQAIETEEDLKKIPLNQNLFIESSAGTGKTYTLENLYARLVKERNLSLNEILVVTFTEAAGKELKERIQEKLKDEPRLISNFHESQIFTIHGFSQKILRDYSSFFEIPDNFSLITRDTELFKLKDESLHSFFRSYQQEIANNEIWLKGYESLLSISGSKNSFNQLKKFLLFFLSEKEIKSLKSFLEEKEATSLKNLWEKKEDPNLFSLISKWKETLYFFLEKEEVKNSFDQRKITKVISAFNQLNLIQKPLDIWQVLDQLTIPDLSTSKEEKNITFNPLQKIFHFSFKMDYYEKAGSLSKGLIEDKEKLKIIAEEIKKELPFCLWEEPKPKEKTSLLTLFLAWNFAYIALEKAKQEMEKFKKQKNLLTFDDLIIKLSRGHLTLKENQKEELKNLYKAILIDEFQDTDNYQWDIFSKVFLNKDSTLSMIGDPKQAIYGFRGAEISSFYLAKEEMLEQDKTSFYYLPTCRRSEKNLIDSFNLLFEEAFREEFKLFQRDYFEKVLSYKEDDPLLSDINPITILLEEETEKDITKTYKDFLFFLENLLVDKNISPKDCLLLSRNRSELKDLIQVAKKLKEERKISLSLFLAEDEPLITKEEYQKTCLLLSFLENPNYHFSQIMLSPFFDLKLEEVAWLCQEEQKDLKHKITANLNEIYNTFFEKGNLWFLFESIEKLSQTVRNEIGQEIPFLSSLRKNELKELNWEERFLIKEEEEALFYFRQSFSWLAQEIQGLKSFKIFLKDISLGKRDIPMTQKFPNQTKIPLMTMHQSKGLEAKFVFILASKEFPNRKWATPSYSFYSNEEIKEDYFHLEKNKKKALLKLWQEEKNLLYVALTRAEKKVFLLSPTPKKNSLMSYFINILSLKPNSKNELASILSGKKCISLETLKKENKIPHYFDTVNISERKPINLKEKYKEKEDLFFYETSFSISEIFKKSPSFSSFSSLTSGHNSLQDNEIVQSPQENLSAIPKGAIVGNWVHFLLEKIPFSTAKNTSLEEWKKLIIKGREEKTIDEVFNNTLKEYLPFLKNKEGVLQEATTMIFNILQTPFIEESLSLSDLDKGKIIKEREFNLKVNLTESKRELLKDLGEWTIPLISSLKNGFMMGILDCLIESKGKLYIIDWKTNFLGNNLLDYDKNKLKVAIQENNYDLQYHLYALSLKIWFKKYKPETSFEEIFGGVYYIFTRAFLNKDLKGEGVFFYKIPIKDLNLLEEFIFQGEKNSNES